MISFVVPAHNEQSSLARTLQAIHKSASIAGEKYEIIVVNDASTDATAEIARQIGAQVINVSHRQIAATRNSGARAAQGERLFFVDADTTINSRAVTSALRAMDHGAIGGGAPVWFDGDAPLYAQLLLWWFNLFMRIAGVCGGAFMFCTREAFQAAGGFDEKLFGAEDAAMSMALNREGRFIVLWKHVRTSGRRMRGMRGLQMLATLFQMAFFPKSLTQRARVKKVWYDSNRDADDKPDSLGVKVINVIVLFILILFVMPIWFLPWPQALLNGPLGNVKFVSNVIGLHIGLVLLPCAYFLFRTLLRQKRHLARIKLVVLITLCAGLGWGNLLELFRFWRWVAID